MDSLSERTPQLPHDRGFLALLRERRWGRARALILAGVVIAGLGRRVPAQTFVQLTELGNNLGPRITKALANQRLGVDLFGQIGTKVTFIDYGTVYQFASDPSWQRILSGLKDQWIHEYTNASGPGGRLKSPIGIDISARKKFYAADRGNRRILVARFDPALQNLTDATSFEWFDIGRVMDVAWDGQQNPLTLDYLYILDDSLSAVTYWNFTNGLPDFRAWSYGTTGSGTGQFLAPSGICVGKTAAPNGGTQFTTYFYVVDRGNRRVVWLDRGLNGPTWINTVSLGTWDPTDCAVDHFGNLYVTDESSHRIRKFTYSLSLLATYGTYGKGTVLNTFAFPHAISVPCGLKTVNSQSVWYCEGRVITAEAWTSGSGAVEHYLGIESTILVQPDSATGGDQGHSLTYSVTDHASHSDLDVMDPNGFHYTFPGTGCTLCPPGQRTVYWNGLKPDGQSTVTGYFTMTVRVNSAYSCPSGATWCHRDVISAPFWHYGSAPPPCSTPPCPERPATQLGVEPTALFLQQRVLIGPRPLARLQGPEATAPAGQVESAPGLTELVRQYGVRGLSFSVTRAAATSPATIKIYALSGRPVRTLVNERLDPGVYEISWDGLDQSGRPAAPGVYIATLTIGSYHAVQRLILRQP